MGRFLLGVDVEDPRPDVEGGSRHAARVPELVDRFLAFLDERGAKATFFVVGAVARGHPDAVRSIVRAGHEIGCHSDRHVPLDAQNPASFRQDTLRALDALAACGADRVTGYRAPCFSLVRRTRWAYPLLAELGFQYSSSVLPAPNPLYGWPGFGRRPKRMSGGIWEIPIGLLPYPFPPLPIGGVYFRALPKWALSLALRAWRTRGQPVVGYLHPYDADPDQPRFAQAGFRPGGFYDWLMHRNRGELFARLAMLDSLGYAIEPLGGFAAALGEGKRDG